MPKTLPSPLGLFALIQTCWFFPCNMLSWPGKFLADYFSNRLWDLLKTRSVGQNNITLPRSRMARGKSSDFIHCELEVMAWFLYHSLLSFLGPCSPILQRTKLKRLWSKCFCKEWLTLHKFRTCTTKCAVNCPPSKYFGSLENLDN